MRFTRWTYFIAIRRAFKRECQEVFDPQMALHGTDTWKELRDHTDALKLRKIRERRR